MTPERGGHGHWCAPVYSPVVTHSGGMCGTSASITGLQSFVYAGPCGIRDHLGPSSLAG